jgi:hypothetical protein
MHTLLCIGIVCTLWFVRVAFDAVEWLDNCVREYFSDCLYPFVH